LRGGQTVLNAWRILKGKKPKGWKGASARRKITPPKSRWNPKAFRMKTFRDHPMYDKLARITGMGTDIPDILDYFEQEGIFDKSQWSREEIEAQFDEPQWSEQEKFETLDYLLSEYLKTRPPPERTIGSAGGIQMQPREVSVVIDDSFTSYPFIERHIDAGKLVRAENPVSVTNFAKDREQSLYDYILPRIGNENNIRSKFENNYLSPNPKVSVETYISDEEGNLPDGIADAMIGLLRGGRHFGYMTMNSDGNYMRGKEKTKHQIQREKPYPRRRRPKMEQSEEEAEFWGWKQQLEDSGEDTGSSHDWTAISVVKQGKVSGAKEGKPRWYINFVAVYHGRDPIFWAGMRVDWDDSYENIEERTGLSSLLNPEIKDWRKW